jgi:uncharacterized protein (TIGR00288 family)
MDKPLTRDDVAVFIDFENVYVSVREKFDATPNFELIMDRCEDYGRIIIARAYADWYRYPRVTSALFANGVEPMYVPTYYYDREVGRTGRAIKNSVDIHLCIDVMRTLYAQTHIVKFVLVTGDRDFIPLVNAIRQHGKEVIVIGIGGAASAHLAQSADEFLFYEQIAELKNQQRAQEDQRAQAERAQAEAPARPERRSRQEGRERGDGRNGKRERQPVEQSEPAVEQAAPTVRSVPTEQPTPKSVYDTLADAIQLARQRGFVSNLGSLKVLMRELDSSFNETKLKDANGKPFAKFKEFVEEAQRLGKAQIFTNGTVTEVFLPGEDPYRMSQFADELAAAQAERELAAEQPQEIVESNGQVPVAPPLNELSVEASTPPTDEEIVSPVAPPSAEPSQLAAAPPPAAEPAFDAREWRVLLEAMSQFSGPVRFIEIFGALRGARNQELVELTNSEIKDLVKQAINRGLLQRTGRGAKAYYRLSAQARAMVQAEQAAQDAPAAQLIEQVGEGATDAANTDDLSANDQRTGKPRRRRRGRARETAPTMGGATPSADVEDTEPRATEYSGALGNQDIVPGQTERVQPSAEDGIVTSPLEEDLEQMADPTIVEPGVPEQPIAQLVAEPAPLPEPVDEPEPALRGAMEAFLEDAAPDSPEAEFDVDGQPATPEVLPTETVQLDDDTVVQQPPLQIDAPAADEFAPFAGDAAPAVDLGEAIAAMPVAEALEVAVLDDAAATDGAEDVAEDAAQPARRQRRRRRKPAAQSNGEQATSEADGEQAAAATASTDDDSAPTAEAAPRRRRARRKPTEE